jgi:hypothetical protein
LIPVNRERRDGVGIVSESVPLASRRDPHRPSRGAGSTMIGRGGAHGVMRLAS